MEKFSWWVFLQFAIFGAFTTVSCNSFVTNEVFALTAFKEAAYDDPYLVLATWNGLDPTPCEWSGVSCSIAKDHVIKLNISGLSLKGFLVPQLGLLANLQELILHGNHITGTIPKEIGLLKNLEVLDLGANQLTGVIPHELGNLTSILKINLQSNGLTGTLPTALGNLRYLQELHLDRNRLQGNFPAIPSSDHHGTYASNGSSVGICRLPRLRVADFSFNFFLGSIPRCLQYLPRSSFQGNCLQVMDPKQRSRPRCGTFRSARRRSSRTVNPRSKPLAMDNEAKHQKASKPTWLLALEIVTATMVGALVCIAALTAFKICNGKTYMAISWKKYSSDKDRLEVYTDSDMLKDILRISRGELEVACEDFSNVIGSSSDSMVYKGIMKDGYEIAVISFCIKQEQWTSYHELYFQTEVADLARLNHENSGRLLGYCRETCPFTRMLVLEYTSNGTLYEHLHYGEGCQLSWSRRMKIIIGIARGLRYLHTELTPPFTIFELNSSAVYLTEEFLPKLVDFESWKTILARSEKNFSEIDSVGEVCVLPSSMEARHLDIKGNIYAFGVLLLEIISGKPPFSKDTGSLVVWARVYLDHPEVMPDMIDPELKHYKHEDLKAVREVASLCLNLGPHSRPSMQELCATLESRIDLTLSAELRSSSSSLAWAELALST